MPSTHVLNIYLFVCLIEEDTLSILSWLDVRQRFKMPAHVLTFSSDMECMSWKQDSSLPHSPNWKWFAPTIFVCLLCVRGLSCYLSRFGYCSKNCKTYLAGDDSRTKTNVHVFTAWMVLLCHFLKFL